MVYKQRARHKQENSEQKLEISGEKADRKWKGI